MVSTLENLGVVLKRYGGLESNIPVNHPYWELLRKYRAGILDAVLDPFEEDGPAPPPPPQAQDKVKLAALRKLCRDTLRDFGSEPNIPYTHDYWFAMNQIKAIERQPE
jgi:hypothetical protein